MAIGFSEWNQRNSDTERRTFWPNLWGKIWVLLGWPIGWSALAVMGTACELDTTLGSMAMGCNGL
jgi:hypothetical protein